MIRKPERNANFFEKQNIKENRSECAEMRRRGNREWGKTMKLKTPVPKAEYCGGKKKEENETNTHDAR